MLAHLRPPSVTTAASRARAREAAVAAHGDRRHPSAMPVPFPPKTPATPWPRAGYDQTAL